MSLLAEIIRSKEVVDLDKIEKCVPQLEKRVERMKKEMLSYVDEVYIRFLDRPKKNKGLASNLLTLTEELKELHETIHQLNNKDLQESANSANHYLEKCQQLDIELNTVDKLNSINEIIQNNRSLLKNQCYVECIKEIETGEILVDSLQEDGIHSSIHQKLREELSTLKIQLLHKLTNQFKDCISFSSGERKTSLELRLQNAPLDEIFSALYYHNESIALLDAFTKFLWNHIFVPIVDNKTQIHTTEETCITLELKIIDPKTKDAYSVVFENIKKILQILSTHLNIKLSEEFTILDYIGRDIRDNLSELIIKHCLQDTIPSTAEGLKEYPLVIKATEDLEGALKESGIFSQDSTSILEYANNISVLFINKKCQGYILQADKLMKKDLHDMIEVGDPEEDSSALVVNSTFPKCSVSKSLLEIFELIENILSEAKTSSELSAGRLYCTAKNISQKYSCLVPEYHKRLLQTIPQQIALFYNNCMYLAHKLTEWSNTHLVKLPSLLDATFISEQCQLEQVGVKMFNDFVDSQVKQIEEIMKGSGLGDHKTLEQLSSGTEKSLRQCLRQQELLRTVWHKVLPYSVYNKHLGIVLNSLCNCIIKPVVVLEDISSDAAEQLVELLKMVQTRGPKLFTDPREISLFVNSWYKLNELAFVLSSSLVEINDRWADGKGPLGMQFNPEELKQLIRALFQNTERRAELLSKIYS